MSDWLAPLDRWAKDLSVLGLFDGLPQAISNARKLAEGRLNLVIVMIEPCNNHATTSYDEMVEKSPALQEVRRLVWTHFHCDFDDVPVFDVRPLISERMRNAFGREWLAWEEKAYGVFEEILLKMKPDAILSLQCVTKDSNSAVCRSLCGSLNVSLQPRIVALGRHETLVFKGFHPSVYLRPDYAVDRIDWTTSERRLSSCFKATFSALHGRRLVRWNNYNTRLSPEMRSALEKEVLVEVKLRQLVPHVIPTQRPSRDDVTPEEVVRMLESLLIT